MLNKIIIISFILNVSVLNAQNRNNISLNIGEKYLTDWIGRFGVEYGLSYSHIWGKHISSSLLLNNYYYEKSELQLPPQGYIQRKSYLESNLGVGYNFAPHDTKLILQSELGLNYRRRSESIVVGSGTTTGGWAEVLLHTYESNDFGGSITIKASYLIMTKLSFGIYGQFKFYPSETYIIYPEGISHDSPNEVSYGLSCGFNF